jgi:hypothetical protein
MTEKVYFSQGQSFDPHVSILSARRGISEKHVFDVCTWSGDEEGRFTVG